MAAGRLAPFHKKAMSGLTSTYPKIYNVGAGAGTWTMEGIGVEASLNEDCHWELLWAMPSTIPAGQMTLELWMRANAKVEPIWGNVAMGASPAAATHTSETIQTFACGGTAHIVNQYTLALDADTVAAGEILSMALYFRTASWTLAAESVWVPWVYWG
jgi:hypothetical protein